MKVRVYHAMHGCDTGCCGHVLELLDEDGIEEHRSFEWAHPGPDRADIREWATDIIRRDWPECLDSIDWETLDVEDARPDC